MLHALLTFGGRGLGKLSRMVHAYATRWEPADAQQRAVVRSTAYDMLGAPDEPYYADQYWNVMLPHLLALPSGAYALDLGCSQGRFALRLAKLFASGRVVGCDLSAEAVMSARQRAATQSIHNVEFRVQSIRDCLQAVAEQSMDAVLMTEVTFFYPEWHEDLPTITECIRPGGILAISFRPQYFYALAAVRNRVWEDVDPVLRERKGRLLGGSATFTWQTSAEIRDLLTRHEDLELLELRGIGACSGIPGDPHDEICRPSDLSNSERQRLMELEMELGRSVADSGRYILAVARKRVWATSKRDNRS